MAESMRESLRGLKVVTFESRRAEEMAELIRRYGGEPVNAPSLREVPLGENREALEILPKLESGNVDLLILTTGIGMRTLNQILLTRYSQDRIVSALKKAQLVARGPKPIAVLKELGLAPVIVVPEPNTWREVLCALDAAGPVRGKQIAIQEYGIHNSELVAGLVQRGATVKPLSIYRWAPPEDLAPLRQAIEKILRGDIDVALFTNGAQADHLFRIATQDRNKERLRSACKHIAIASIGPVCTQVLEQFDLKPDIEPARPKMGSLIAEVAVRAAHILTAKR